MENLLLSKRAPTKQRKRPGRIARRGPPGPAIQREPLVAHDADEAAGAEGGGVGLAFDLEDVEGEEDDFADADERAGGGVQDGFAGAGAEGVCEEGRVVLGQVVADEGLAAVFVDALEDLGGLDGGAGVGGEV